jgi:hypothetical protein
MSSCGIDDRSILHMAVRVIDGITITVKVNDESVKVNDKSTTVTFLSSDTGRSIKYYMKGAEGYAGRLIACLH